MGSFCLESMGHNGIDLPCPRVSMLIHFEVVLRSNLLFVEDHFHQVVEFVLAVSIVYSASLQRTLRIGDKSVFVLKLLQEQIRGVQSLVILFLVLDVYEFLDAQVLVVDCPLLALHFVLLLDFAL